MTRFPAVGDVFGRYRVVEIIGRGGMGVVFSAVQEDLDRKVALKVLAPELASDERFRSRFTREASALAKLDSPHIIHIYEHGEHDGCLFIATQLVGGGDLRNLLEATGGLPALRAIEIVAQVCAALADAHAAGVVHRDIKPANVLLRRSDAEDFAYVCDFGIAQTNDEQRTRSVGVVGTVAYMAPERHRGAEATVASDVYSAGCLLWATLTGAPPYAGTDVQVAMAHLHETVPVLPGIGQLQLSVSAIVRRAMAKSPEERYPSASTMRADLLAALADSSKSGGATGVTSRHDAREPVSAPAARAPRSRGLRALAVGAAVAVAGVVGWELLGAARQESTTDKVVSGTCWSGEMVSDVRRCTTPRGVAGMRWVFPSLDDAFEECMAIPEDEVEPVTKVRAYFCPFADNPREGVRYNEWRTPAAALAHHQDDYQPYKPQELDDDSFGYLWRRLSPDEHQLVTATMAYRDWPFSLSVQSDRLAGLDAGCSVVRVRSPEDFEPVADACRLQ